MSDQTPSTDGPERDRDAAAPGGEQRPLRTTVTRVPHNAETDLRVLREPQTPTDAFYVRSNFPTPALDADRWALQLKGTDGSTRGFTLAELKELGPAQSRLVTLECAGNGRTLLDPPVPGTGWTLGGTSTGTFTGLPLRALLDQVPPDPGTVEVVFTGGDRGSKEGWPDVPFQRSLPLDAARAEPHGPLLAWAMNGEPLRPDHGAPVRLVVPGWYAVASVKWLVEIRYADRPFEGCFQTDRYRYLVPGEAPRPVRRMRVRSLVLDPLDGAELAPGPVTVSGTAWSGHGEVAGVQVSVDGGRSWREAEVQPSSAPFTPGRWCISWQATPGEHEIVARARDAAGNEQPLTQWWNELGYGNNQVHRVRVVVRRPPTGS